MAGILTGAQHEIHWNFFPAVKDLMALESGWEGKLE
jgi:hypothetical protein